MKFVLLLCALAVLAIATVDGYPSKGSTKASLTNKKKQCIQECGDLYKPVCAGDGTGKGDKSFGSECVLNNYNCESGNNLKVVSQGECPGGGGIRLQ